MTEDDAAVQRPMYWCPGGPPENRQLVHSWTPGRSDADSWGAYHQVLFPPHQVTPWIRFKIMTSGVNVARGPWDEREALRADYEGAHGDDPEAWPVRFPGVVLESVEWVTHVACLGCQWLDKNGPGMRRANWRATADGLAIRQQVSR